MSLFSENFTILSAFENVYLSKLGWICIHFIEFSGVKALKSPWTISIILGSLSKIEKRTFEPTEELLKHAANYLKHLLDDSNETKSEELISLNHLTNLVNLTDDEKIKFIGLQENKKNE